MTQLQQSQLNSGQTFTASGELALAGDSSPINWTGSVTDTIGSAYTGPWSAYYGSMAAEASIYAGTTWANSALTALGAPYQTVGLANWTNTSVNTTATDTISYSFSSPLPAGVSFMLWDPGASIPNNSGPFTFQVSATDNGVAANFSNWTFQIESPTGNAPGSNISVNTGTGTITVNSYLKNSFPDSIIVITPNAPITGISVTAQTIPYDFWGLMLPATNALFSTGSDKVDFNALTTVQQLAVAQGVDIYDGLGGSDIVTLPNGANYNESVGNGQSLGWAPAQTFYTKSKAGDNYTVNCGDGNYNIALGAGSDTVNVAGNGTTAIACGAGTGTINVEKGYDAILTVNKFVAGDVINLLGAQASIIGGGEFIAFAAGTGNTVTLSNTANVWDFVSGSGGTIDLADAQTAVSGGGDTIGFAASGNMVSLYNTAGVARLGV